jgi:hypothetical protein
MANCKLLGSCFLINAQVIDMPLTMEYMKDIYCNGCFTECAIYQDFQGLWQSKVPIFPEL